MSENLITTTSLKYLDKALNRLRDLGLMPESTDEAPIVALLNQITGLDEAKVISIARTLNQASTFNDVVREQISAMEIGDRYQEITEAFNSIRDDARDMVRQIEDGRVDSWERLKNIWMKVSRGDIATRFGEIKETYLDVAKDSKDQMECERLGQAESEQYKALTQARVGQLTADDEVIKSLNQAERRVEGFLVAREHGLRELQRKLDEMQARQAALESERTAQSQQVERAAKTLDDAEAAIQERLTQDAAYQAQLARARQAERIAEHPEKKTTTIVRLLS
jgi:hypothetical protein